MLKNYCYHCLLPASWKNSKESKESSLCYSHPNTSQKQPQLLLALNQVCHFFHSIVPTSQNYKGRKEAKIPVKQCWVHSNKNDLPLFICIYELTSLHPHFHYLGIRTDSQS